MMYYYSIYNLIVQSQLILPNMQMLPIGETKTLPDITITFGTISKEGLDHPISQGCTYQTTKTDFWLNIPSIARFLVSNGQQITIEPTEGIDEDSIRTFLLSTCLEVLLKQRQISVLTGFALKLGEYGVSFTGTPGIGQSILQGIFYKRGYSFLGGTIFAFNNKGKILPGIAQIEFWPQAATALGLETEALQTLRPGIKKYLIPLKQQFEANPLPLKIIYILKMHKQPDIIFSKVNNEHKRSYLQQLIKENTVSADLWQNDDLTLEDSEILNTMELICIHLPMTGLKVHQVVDSIENDFVERGYYHVQL